MTHEKMLSLCEAQEFQSAAIISTRDVVIHREFRAYCEENACGNYNANYGCPPDCGTPEFMEARVRGYSYALVMQTKLEIDDIDDKELVAEVRKEHVRKSRAVFRRLQEDGMELRDRMMLPGKCTFCKVCKKAEGLPCAFPDRKSSCLSAYGIDVTALCEACGMTIDWDGSSISYFSLYLF